MGRKASKGEKSSSDEFDAELVRNARRRAETVIWTATVMCRPLGSPVTRSNGAVAAEVEGCAKSRAGQGHASG